MPSGRSFIVMAYDEQHMTRLHDLNELRARIARLKTDIDDDPTCGFGEAHTGPPLYRPEGPRCGKPATHVIFWDDGRWSLGCLEHLGPFEPPAPPCYVVRMDMGSHGEVVQTPVGLPTCPVCRREGRATPGEYVHKTLGGTEVWTCGHTIGK